MVHDQQALLNAQRHAYTTMTTPMFKIMNADGTSSHTETNQFYVKPTLVTMPAKLIQEQPYVNSKSTFTFNFSSNGPEATAALGNIVMGKNNVVQIYALQFLIGYGAVAATRQYQSFGAIANDNAIYNSIFRMKIESSTYIDFWHGLDFREVPDSPTGWNQHMGVQILNPQRAATGEFGTFNVTINLLNDISGVVLSPNAFLSMQLIVAFGQAEG